MAPFPFPLVGSLYNPCTDTYSWIKSRRREIKDLLGRMITITSHHSSIKSSKEDIDQSLRNSVYREKSKEYPTVESRIRVFHNKYIELIKKYIRVSGNPLSLNDDDSVMITELENLETKVWTLKFFKLAKLSRDADKLDKEAREVLERLKPEIMIQKKLESLHEMFDDKRYNLPVFDKYVDEVLDYLFAKGYSSVGIWGAYRVGKTTVLRKLFKHLNSLHGSEFEHVIMVEYPPEEVSDETVVKLQKEIMFQLNIHHEVSSMSSPQQNGNAISAFLRVKKYILLMDQVPCKIELDQLGFKQDHEHKKVVIASTEEKVIRQMTEHKVEIKVLEKDEGSKLFESICGIVNDPRKKDIADVIIECCGGIPWIIRHVALHLKDKENERSWNNTKTILQSDSKSNKLLELNEFTKVYEIEYEELDDYMKKCLLYGALFPMQYKIYVDYIVECWIAEGFIVDEDAQKVRAIRDRGQGILDYLTNKHLLQWCSDKQCITMPPFLKSMALELPYPGEDDCVIWMPSKEGMMNDNTWSNVTRLSSIRCPIKLPSSPRSSNICTLLLQSSVPDPITPPDLFFHHMEKLKVLDLSHLKIIALPDSVSRLVNLKSLYLISCMDLNSLPSEAEKLVKLEFLDISGTSIPSLPQEIEFMKELRCLRAMNLKLIIPQGRISNLTKLEELCIGSTFDFENWIDVANDLASLKHLNKLCFNFPDVKSLNTFVEQSEAIKNKHTRWKSATFQSFIISIGGNPTRHPYESDFSGIIAERWLRCFSTEEFSPACQVVLNQASAFEILDHPGVESLNQFDMRSVKACLVGRCSKFKHVVDGYTASEERGYVMEKLPQNLEKLYLYKLDSLGCICNGPVPSQSFTNLTTIEINGCPSLTKIFDLALASTLQSLEKFKVENCSEILNIIEVDDKSNNSELGQTSEIVEIPEGSSSSKQGDLTSILKSLKTIEMSNMPKLESICPSDSISWKSLKSIIVKNCNNLQNLSLTSTNAQKLGSIQGEESWWNSIELSEELRHHLSFYPLTGESSEPVARPDVASTSSGRDGPDMTEHIMFSDDSFNDNLQGEGFMPKDVSSMKDSKLRLKSKMQGDDGTNTNKMKNVETMEELNEEGSSQALSDGDNAGLD